MLKGIPRIISPDLLKVLSEMGHGDEIVLGDGNFQGSSLSRNILIRYEASDIPLLLDAILQVFPLDTDLPSVSIMNPDKEIPDPQVWYVYKEIIKNRCGPEFDNFEKLERYDFYERAKKSYAIITTSEKALFANIILKKGVIE